MTTNPHSDEPQKDLAQDAVLIRETPEFVADFALAFSDVERRAVHLVLSDNPLVGTSISNMPWAYQFKFCGKILIYSLSQNFRSVLLLAVTDKPPEDPPPGSREHAAKSRLDELSGGLIRGGAIAAGKKAVDELIELVVKWVNQ